ncbi:PTS sugar transporter subunit IIA [Oceanidesulfovibrio marinus]|uniref:PTS sugar transporter subunit IIA n=1 Tax=Oceanidesulfovibrio marinus TaxID=370038 RepID=A0A6P1ZCG2_9BACT|nr:PTS sugar transporter subunit IIA [Oceanidesulfovibrio marinus]QJT08033.1 PTS sugar transporter subunit IIA [Oceanidesulfovibrio marinus]TVM30448.1 PTS sugar transporter subunit IIA [Oceanidesulfovibrio marinus]
MRETSTTEKVKSAKQLETPVQTGVVVVTHAHYGASLIEAAEFILGKQQWCEFVSVDGTRAVEDTRNEIQVAVSSCDQGQGVIILTDMFGGTPTNLSLSLLGAQNLEVVTGVNLPMLLKVLGSRSKEPADLALDAKAAGSQGIVVAGEILRSKVGGK